MERLQAGTEQELNMILREMVEEMGATRICSNTEAARLVRGREDDEAIEWMSAQKSKMEKIATVWDCKRGDMVTIRVETNDDDKPTRLVQGKVTEIPNRVLTRCRQKTEREVITVDDEEYQVDTVILISITKQTPAKSAMEEADSPTSTRDTGGAKPSPSPSQVRQPKRHRRQEFESPSVQNNTREEESEFRYRFIRYGTHHNVIASSTISTTRINTKLAKQEHMVGRVRDDGAGNHEGT